MDHLSIIEVGGSIKKKDCYVRTGRFGNKYQEKYYKFLNSGYPDFHHLANGKTGRAKWNSLAAGIYSARPKLCYPQWQGSFSGKDAMLINKSVYSS